MGIMRMETIQITKDSENQTKSETWNIFWGSGTKTERSIITQTKYPIFTISIVL